MFKYFSFITCITLLLASCHSASEKQADKAIPLPAAEKQLRDEIAAHPDSIILQEKLIQYFRDNGNYSQATAETNQLLKKDSNNVRLLYIHAMLLSENGDTLQAIPAWEKLVHIDPRPENIVSLGTLYSLTKNPLALKAADYLLSIANPQAQSKASFIKALYYANADEKNKAIDFFDKCLQLDYSYLPAYREKAICLYDIGKPVDALKVLELSNTINKTNEEAYYWIGRCYEKLGKKEAAIQNYQTALQLVPDFVEAKDALARLGQIQ